MASKQIDRVKLGRLIHAFIRAGWNPPLPSDYVMHRILDDLAKVQPQATLELSPRERQCLQFAALGLSKQEIADDLGISYEMVRDYWKRIFRRLGAKNQAHAVAIGIRAGVIDPPEEPHALAEAA